MSVPKFPSRKRSFVGPMVTAFAAGFLATLVFHQGMLAVLHFIGLTQRTAFSLEPTAPLGVPEVFSMAFWGGVWGMALAYAASLLAETDNTWLFALLFGAIVPSLVNWFVAAPLHGDPLGKGWHLPAMATSLLVDAAWGLGTALLLRLRFGRQGEQPHRTPSH